MDWVVVCALGFRDCLGFWSFRWFWALWGLVCSVGFSWVLVLMCSWVTVLAFLRFQVLSGILGLWLLYLGVLCLGVGLGAVISDNLHLIACYGVGIIRDLRVLVV